MILLVHDRCMWPRTHSGCPVTHQNVSRVLGKALKIIATIVTLKTIVQWWIQYSFNYLAHLRWNLPKITDCSRGEICALRIIKTNGISYMTFGPNWKRYYVWEEGECDNWAVIAVILGGSSLHSLFLFSFFSHPHHQSNRQTWHLITSMLYLTLSKFFKWCTWF